MRPQRWLLALAGASVLWAATGADPFTAAQRDWYLFKPVKRPAVPAVQDQAWTRTPVDAFILSRLEAKGIRPRAEADRATLLRRVTVDLTGLLPTPEDAAAFLADRSPDAYEKAVDRLLSSPHYGERWARHWLDVARFAESEGFKSDETRPNAWRYRDYVVRAFNENRPYDRFVKEQIAGDELWPASLDARVATAFSRHYPDESNARNLMQRRQEILNDVTDTVGSAFLGLTVGCARCHNHKFDAISHADYYRLQAFFANTTADDRIVLLPPGERATYEARLASWEEKTKAIRIEMAALLEPKKRAWVKDNVDKYPPEIQAVIAKPAAERNPYEWQMWHKAKHYLVCDDETAARALKGEEKGRHAELQKALAAFAGDHPGELPVGVGMGDIGREAPKTFVMAGGAYDAPGEEVQPGYLTVLDPKPAVVVPSADGRSTGRRTALANWLTSPDNPITARVMVNRLWLLHFGQGLAGNPNDLGMMGQRPSHPELLDWLASEFVSGNWDVKRMHRLIVTSSAYRQSATQDETAAKADPRNRLLWRFPRQRMEAEVVRDAALQVSGLLNPAVGGPSVFPELPAGLPPSRGGWALSANPADRNRRSLYIFVRRNARYPLLETFDMPDTHESCGRRNTTVTAPQALSLLNGNVSLQWAQGFAARVLREAGLDGKAQVERAYRLSYGRGPSGAELDTVLTFLQTHEAVVAERVSRGETLALPAQVPDGMRAARAATLVDFCHMLLNSNEFVYRN